MAKGQSSGGHMHHSSEFSESDQGSKAMAVTAPSTVRRSAVLGRRVQGSDSSVSVLLGEQTPPEGGLAVHVWKSMPRYVCLSAQWTICDQKSGVWWGWGSRHALACTVATIGQTFHHVNSCTVSLKICVDVLLASFSAGLQGCLVRW